MGQQNLPRQEKQGNRSHDQNQEIAQIENNVKKLPHKELPSALMK